MVDRRRVEGDLIPHEKPIKRVDRDARQLPERVRDDYVFRRNGKQTCQFLGVFACKRRFRGGRRACQGEHGRQGQSDEPMEISSIARGFQLPGAELFLRGKEIHDGGLFKKRHDSGGANATQRSCAQIESYLLVQGVISPLLSNILLTLFDKEMRQKETGSHGGVTTGW